MTIDGELLKAAAEAAGVKWIDPNFDFDDFGRLMVDFGQGCTEWNPLTDDGDALRLAVKLRITPHLYQTGYTYVATDSVANPEGFDVSEPWGANPYAATRRAIVRAAAAITTSR